MKKRVFMLIAALGVVLTGCSVFDSKPIEPKIIGAGNLHYDTKNGIWFVLVDSTRYAVANVTIPNHNRSTAGKTQNIEPVGGMLVTVFTSPRKIGLQAVAGRQSAEQIEELYHTNSSVILIILGLFLFFALAIMYVRAAGK